MRSYLETGYPARAFVKQIDLVHFASALQFQGNDAVADAPRNSDCRLSEVFQGPIGRTIVMTLGDRQMKLLLRSIQLTLAP